VFLPGEELPKKGVGMTVLFCSYPAGGMLIDMLIDACLRGPQASLASNGSVIDENPI
jgi:hypothetical protein